MNIKRLSAAAVLLLSLWLGNHQAAAAPSMSIDENLGLVHISNSVVESDYKVIISKDNQAYTYAIGQMRESLALQMGPGFYTIELYTASEKGEYALISTDFAFLSEEASAQVFLNSTQNIQWSKDMPAIQFAQALTEGLKTDREKVEAIYDYLLNHLAYDDQKAQVIDGTYLPNIEETFDTNTGVCYDFSSLFASMLRSANIPAKLVTGYKNDISTFHAWNQVLLDGQWQTIDVTYDVALKDAGQSSSMTKNASEYQVSEEY